MFTADTRFLIVDDTKTIRSLLKEILKNIGYNKWMKPKMDAKRWI